MDDIAPYNKTAGMNQEGPDFRSGGDTLYALKDARPCTLSCRPWPSLRPPWFLHHIDQRIDEVTGEIETLARDDQARQRLMKIPGIGPIIASASFILGMERTARPDVDCG